MDSNLSTGGWIFMIGSVGFVTALVVFCYYRVFTAPADSDTHDEDT